MRKDLTKVEKLDYQHPGLADQLRQWMSQGIPCRQIVELVLERYQVRLSKSALGRFRTRRWAPEQERLREKLVEAHAAQELQREREIRSAMDGILGDLK